MYDEEPAELYFDENAPLPHDLGDYVHALEKYERACRDMANGTGRFTDKALFDGGRSWGAERVDYQNKRATVRGAAGTLTEDEWWAIIAAFEHACAYCGEKRDLDIEHVVPIARGGDTTLSNCVPGCSGCNSRKSSRLLEEWLGAQFASEFRARHAALLAAIKEKAR